MSESDPPETDLTDLVPVAPVDRIAVRPAARREDALLLVAPRDGGAFEDLSVQDLAGRLARGDLLVLNETRVVPARVHATRMATGGRAELLVLVAEAESDRCAPAVVETRGHPEAGELFSAGDAVFCLRAPLSGGRGQFELVEPAEATLLEVLEAIGQTPLPPYVLRARRETGTESPPDDAERYQTVFARDPGAVAAPTAGLHLTDELLDAIESAGVEIARLVLHVGPGTFLPIRAADPREHPMAMEPAWIPEETAAAVARARARGGRVIAVGTTCVRALESAASAGGVVRPGKLEAGIYIHPPHEFAVVDGMLTNFHMPDSTPCLLVAALLGAGRMRAAYEHALAGAYRFYSYGDAMLVI